MALPLEPAGNDAAEPLFGRFFGESLHESLRISLRWLPLAAELPGSEADHDAESNVRLLNVVAQLDERSKTTEDPENHEIELARLHDKLDLLLTAVGALLGRQMDLPPATPIMLGAQGAAWQQTGLEIGSLGRLELYLNPALMYPVRLQSRITHSELGWVMAGFHRLHEAERSALERYVFLMHRRLVADRRAVARKHKERA